MDKLKPILDQKFWILSALAIILSVTGWFMSKGTLSAEIEKRRGELKTAFDSVKVAGSNPNEKWTQQVSQQNDLLAKELRIAYEQLYERQKSLMFWPDGFSEAAKLGDPTKVTSTDAAVYRARYPDHAEEVRSTIEPYDEETGAGKVKFPPERMVDVGLNIQKWQVQSPVGQEIYEAQEDLWLYQNLFTAIASINRAATGPADATIRDVIEVVLRGGDPDKIGQSSSTASSGGGMDPAMMGGAAGGQFPGAPAGGGAAGPKLSGGKVDFNPDDEFGPDSDGSGGGGSPDAAISGPAGDAFGAAGQQTAAPRKRYIKETDQYKTRGFYLKMVIDHRKLPEVIAGLTAAPWPIRITRVHQVDLHPDDLFDAGPSPGGAGFAGAPAMAAGAGFGAGAPGGVGGDAAGPPQIGGASLLAAGTTRGGGFGNNPGAGFGNAAPAGAPAGAAFNPEDFGAPMGLGANPGVDSADPMAAAMADPDLVVVTIDGWVVMYKAPPADPNAAAPSAPAESAPESQQTPAATPTDSPPAEAAATEPAAAPATGETPPADAPTAAPAAETPPAETPATPAPAASTPEGTPAPAAPAAPPDEAPPAEPKPAGES